MIIGEWNDIKGKDSNVVLKPFDCSRSITTFYDSERIRTIENLNILLDGNNFSQNYAIGVFGSGSGIPYGISLTTYKKINVSCVNRNSNDYFEGFLGANRLEECKVTGAYRGFVLCKGVTNCVVDTAYEGFDRCKLMYKNLATNCTTKYSSLSTDNCCSSLGEDSTYFIPANGSDTVNAGFNV